MQLKKAMKELHRTPWTIVESHRLAKRRSDRDEIIDTFLRNVPSAREIPDMRVRLRRELLAIRLPVARPAALPIAAATCRALLSVTSLAMITHLLFLGNQSIKWDGTRFSKPLPGVVVYIGIGLVAVTMVALQVMAEFTRARTERLADAEQAAAQIELFFERASAFLSQPAREEMRSQQVSGK